MGKLVVGVMRLLPLCALWLLLPSFAAAQCSPVITIQRAWTQDTGGKEKTQFAPGETIQFAALVSSNYGGSGQTQLAITTSFYNDTKTVNIPLGSSTWTSNATAPSTPGNNTVTAKLIDPFCGVWVEKSGSFTIGQSSLPAPQPSPSPDPSAQHPPLPPAPGWHHNGAGTILGVSAVLYQDSAGLRITWQNSYIYQHPGQDPLYWYTEVIYFNMSNQTLPVSCVGRTTPSFAKEHMRGTANSGYVVAEETFCSRNPNFTASLGPGGTHTEWAIFHNVPWQGGEVSLEWMPYGFSEWVDSWYSPYPSATPPPAECPSELVGIRLRRDS